MPTVSTTIDPTTGTIRGGLPSQNGPELDSVTIAGDTYTYDPAFNRLVSDSGPAIGLGRQGPTIVQFDPDAGRTYVQSGIVQNTVASSTLLNPLYSVSGRVNLLDITGEDAEMVFSGVNIRGYSSHVLTYVDDSGVQRYKSVSALNSTGDTVLVSSREAILKEYGPSARFLNAKEITDRALVQYLMAEERDAVQTLFERDRLPEQGFNDTMSGAAALLIQMIGPDNLRFMATYRFEHP